VTAHVMMTLRADATGTSGSARREKGAAAERTW
jgi:hypothetical protein